MAFSDSNHQRAAWLIFLLGLGLLIALLPYASGLVGGLVLYVVFRPVHGFLVRWLPPALAAGLVVALALALILIPTVVFAGLVVDQARDIATGVIGGPLLERLAALEIGGFEIGPRLAGLVDQIITWIGANAFGLVGTATRVGLNLTIALFIAYFLLQRPERTWEAVKPYIPFSAASAELLRARFHDVTVSTVIGTGLVACVQGALVGLGFWLTGLSNALFWGLVTVVLAILPVVGAGLVWVPGVLSLVLAGRIGAGVTLALIGLVLVANVDVVIRPAVFRRYAQIHPLVTLVGAVAGVSYFGLLGILIGPLAVSYFFELIRLYKEEYIEPDARRA
ncbi:MAG TPA: AI-2E family transporter [Gemmatimonadales bacterium]|nr:AI-2E family transporter [Gemmatimonadales bacterium]